MAATEVVITADGDGHFVPGVHSRTEYSLIAHRAGEGDAVQFQRALIVISTGGVGNLTLCQTGNDDVVFGQVVNGNTADVSTVGLGRYADD